MFPTTSATPIESPTTHTKLWDDVRLSEKIWRACKVARANGHQLLWIDSCCIDKTSSAELSEAINSMFRWYRDASVCYAFLADVPSSDTHAAGGGDRKGDSDGERIDRGEDLGLHGTNSPLHRSRWFRRGWTLQELIAPSVVVFLSLDWRFLGTKASLARPIEAITGIDRAVLLHRMQLDEVSVARRMSWAAERQTTRIEDQAYSLLGIFDISMPTLYGEGPRAFARLQEEILKRIPHQSLFSWGNAHRLPPAVIAGVATRTPEHDSNNMSTGIMTSCRIRFSASTAIGATSTLFADSPARFRDVWSTRALSHEQFVERLGFPTSANSDSDLASRMAPWKHITTPYGVRTRIPLIPVVDVISHDALASPPHECSNIYFALLACEPSSHPGHLMAAVCTVKRAHTGTGLALATGGTWSIVQSSGGRPLEHSGSHAAAAFRVTALSPEILERCRAYITTDVLHVPLEDTQRPRVARPVWKQTEIRLARWSQAILRELGYAVVGGRTHARAHRYRLVKGDDAVVVEFDYRDTAEWSTEVFITVSLQSCRIRIPGGATSEEGSLRPLGAGGSGLRLVRMDPPAPPQQLRLGDYYKAKRCTVQLSSGQHLTLVFTLHRISSTLGYLDVQVLAEGGPESMHTDVSANTAGSADAATEPPPLRRPPLQSSRIRSPSPAMSQHPPIDRSEDDIRLEFEKFKQKALLANKLLARANSTLSTRVEDLNGHISNLYCENLRLRASEIALTSQLNSKKERGKPGVRISDALDSAGFHSDADHWQFC